MDEFYLRNIKIFIFTSFLVLLAGFLFVLNEVRQFEPNIYFYYAPPEKSFIDVSENQKEYGFEDYVKEKINSKKDDLVKEKQSFIYLDLKKMNLFLYEEGELLKTFPVQSKGRVGTWWETPPGSYYVGDKVVNHFSTIANVWAPYAIQFYGNFFIHGWPYDNFGRALPIGPSGGCVRLKTSDAIILFDFAKRGMPVLVFEEKATPPLPALLPTKKELTSPDIQSSSFMVADIDTGELLLAKEIDSQVYAGPMNNVMMALTASEIVSSEKRIIARNWMIEDFKENIIKPGFSYRVNDLLRPLLLSSSKEAASVLSRFFTPDIFVSKMNQKSRSIGMNNTTFNGLTFEQNENITALRDAAKMIRYIHQYRGFIFNTGRKFKTMEDEKESLFTVLQLSHENSTRKRNIFIAVVDSSDSEEELKKILLWLDNNLNLTQ